MSLLLVIAGLLLMAVGALLIFRPPKQPEPPTVGRPEALPDIGEWIKQIKELMTVFQQNVRTGLMVMIFGLILVSLGTYLEVRDTKQAMSSLGTHPNVAHSSL